ncbi:MAG TPA: FeoA family protein [Bacillota bacterium]|nr:FeoA family protein [Bacillota bacterium]HUM55556.1 FeoA family protein [Bacillota bacterium]
MTLDMLKPGARARITAVKGKGALRRRLLDLGLTPGTIVMIRKVAPLGDPVEICLRGFELSLRKAEASEIEVAAEDCSENTNCNICPYSKPEDKTSDE